MKATRIAVGIVIALVGICTLRLVFGWIQDTEKARSEQLKQSHFIARVLSIPPSPASAHSV
jgi:hypothetical protein